LGHWYPSLIEPRDLPFLQRAAGYPS